jgi:biopolymer transport protein ExbB/TolQ
MILTNISDIWNEISGMDWVNIISTASSAICILIYCLFKIVRTVKDGKAAAEISSLENEKEQLKLAIQTKELEYSKAAKEEAEKRANELNEIKQLCVKSMTDNAAAAEAKKQAEKVNLSSSIEQSKNILNSIINK